MNNIMAIGLTGGMLLLSTGYANAAVIYDNGQPNAVEWDVGAHLSDSSLPHDYLHLSGDNFFIGRASTINEVRWWGFYAGVNESRDGDNFTISIYDMNNGFPLSQPLYLRNLGDVGGVPVRNVEGPGGGSFEFEYLTAIEAVTLQPGQYLLSIVNETFCDNDGYGCYSSERLWDNWYWETTPQRGTSWQRQSDTSEWIANNSELAFSLFGRGEGVREPQPIALLGLGLIVLYSFSRVQAGRYRREP